jgi:coenzyme F420-reducing hydrogenase alpha subunit/Ni,Fe-hydrogenase III small subunit
MAKTKIAIFDLTGCQGCEFNLLSLNEALLDFSQDFEITNWRLLQKEKSQDFDIAFIEGAVTTEEQIKLIKKIRETAKIVVAIGACAITGNVFAELTPEKRKKLAQKIYSSNYKIKAKFLEPVGKFVKVDENITGCPVEIKKIKEFLKKIKKQKITSKIKTVSPPEYLAKIEGHGTLKVNFRLKKVVFEIEESERLVEGLVLGKPYYQAPPINARICGICPVAHNLCSWKAIEDALGIIVPQEVVFLRKILLASQIIKSHLLHLFFLVLPQHAGLTSSLKLSQSYPAEFHLMLNIKRITDQIALTIGGETLFSANITLGGFLKIPSQEELFSIKDSIWQVIDEAQDLIKLFASFQYPTLEVKNYWLTIQSNEEYPLYEGKLNRKNFLKEKIAPNSPAKLAFWKNKPVKVGALSRVNLFQNCLNPKTKATISQLNLKFPYINPFFNNLAQAIEILHFLEEIVNLIDTLSQKDLNKAKGIESMLVPQKEVFGEAVLEAPRGTLLHQITITPEGKIKNYNIVTPTLLNLTSLPKEVKELIKKTGTKTKIETIEALIRAFDPCITCAVH